MGTEVQGSARGKHEETMRGILFERGVSSLVSNRECVVSTMCLCRV